MISLLSSTSITGNDAVGCGGGVYVSGVSSALSLLSGTVLSDNTAQFSGAHIFDVAGGAVTLVRRRR